MKTRAEHLAWCKERALEYVDTGDTASALASMLSDLRRHPETASHPAIQLTGSLMLGGFLNTDGEVRNHIEGFN